MTRNPPIGKHRRSMRAVAVAPVALVALAVATAAMLPASGAGADVTVSGNLVSDPEFASGTGAWTAPTGISMSVVNGYNGHKAIALTNVTKAPLTANLNDKVNTVASTVQGATYTASAWIRVNKPTVSAAVREGEWQGTVSMASPAVTSATLSTNGWRFVKLDYIAASNGASVDLNYLAWSLPPKVTFYVSQPSLIATVPVASSPTVSSPPPATSSSVAPPASSSSSVAPPPTSSSVAPPPSSSSSSSAPAPSPTSSSAAAPSPTSSSSSSSTITSPSSVFKRLTFDDEFDGATLDTSKWNVNQYQLPYEMSESVAKNVSLRNSDLVIPAIRETGPHGRPWTSAYVDTRGGKFSQKYGRFEARIKINTTADNSSGLWPAFWLRPDNTAYTGEIDIMEAWGEKSTGYTTQVYPAGGAFTSFLADTNHADNRKQTVTLRPATGTRLSDGFHTYALEWTPTTMAVYLDNVQVGPTLDPTSMPWWNNYDTPFHIRLQMQVGQLKYSYPDLTPGYWGTPTSSTTSYSEMLVDWVRVWGQ